MILGTSCLKKKKQKTAHTLKKTIPTSDKTMHRFKGTLKKWEENSHVTPDPYITRGEWYPLGEFTASSHISSNRKADSAFPP